MKFIDASVIVPVYNGKNIKKIIDAVIFNG